MQRDLFVKSMRRMVCLQDEWTPISFEEVRRLEIENAAKLNEKLSN